ncbi:Tachylectin, partial [Amycolatopsis arida]
MMFGLLVSPPAHAVAGGGVARAVDYGFIAKIEVSGARGCTGVLIDPEWVLTARSCFSGNGVQAAAAGSPMAEAIIGRPDLATNAGKSVSVMSVVSHPERDVALGRLAEPVWNVDRPAIARTAPGQGEVLRVAGFGRTEDVWVPDKLQHARFRVQSVASTTVEVVGEDGASTCKGDAGGPALRERNGAVELVAINSASWQKGCLEVSETRQGGIETRVDGLDPWLRQHVPNLYIECKSAVPIFAVHPDDTMWLDQHTAPRYGNDSWIDGQHIGGNGWISGRALASIDGVVYAAKDNGELRRYRWNGAAWDRPNGGWYDVIDYGWERYTTDAYRNRVTADSKGHIYTIEPDGNLHWRSYDHATKQWEHRVVESGWGQYDLIVAAGDGVLYARTPDG